jgi:uncharacterized protein
VKLPRRNSEAELDAFIDVCDRIGGFDGHLSGPERIDGYITALVCAATAVPFDEWIEKMAGDAFERAFADPEDRRHAERTIQARRAAIEDQLDPEALYAAPDALRLSPLIFPWGAEERERLVSEGKVPAEHAQGLVTGAEWAEGFGAALEDYAGAWPDGDDAEDQAYAESLGLQVLVLRLPEASDELRNHVRAVYGDAGADRDRLIDDACFAVQDLRLWIVDHAPKPATRRVDKTPGRNDPCHCGSGRKFKKCHGA